MEDNNPLVSVITVSFNSVKTIERTILSVINQTYKNIEYTIIDGGSTDGTIDIIKKYQDKISYCVSEKDNGIYDAMNKGTNKASGKYLNFMNSDDYFFSDSIVEEVIPLFNNEYEIIYGNTEIRYKDFKIIKKGPNIKYLWMGPINHQSSFVKRETMEKYMYNVNNRIVADFEFFLNVYYNHGKILKINKTIASFSNDGISQKNDQQMIIDCYQTVRKFKDNAMVKLYYKFLNIKPVIKKILPGSVFKFIKKLLNILFVQI